MKFLTQYEQVYAGLSLRVDGDMKIRDDGGDQESVINQRNFFAQSGIAYERFVYGKVQHGTNVTLVDSSSDKVIADTDALITKERGLFIGITVADCFPVYFYAPKSGMVGVAHAGWRGIVKEIIPKTLIAMKDAGAATDDIRIEIGPGISQANFEFHFSEMIQEFGRYNQDCYIKKTSSLDKINVDLIAIIIDQIEDAGVPAQNVQQCRECTFADEKYFSARRHQGESHEAMLAVIGVQK